MTSYDNLSYMVPTSYTMTFSNNLINQLLAQPGYTYASLQGAPPEGLYVKLESASMQVELPKKETRSKKKTNTKKDKTSTSETSNDRVSEDTQAVSQNNETTLQGTNPLYDYKFLTNDKTILQLLALLNRQIFKKEEEEDDNDLITPEEENIIRNLSVNNPSNLLITYTPIIGKNELIKNIKTNINPFNRYGA